ncbi:MAG: carboxymuconolactone decarboxylase family protein [Alphaproteobacteria bacterium]
MKRPNNASGAQLAKVAPQLNKMTQNVVFDEVWDRPGLSHRDRSMITIAALISMHRPELYSGHMRTGMENGLTREEIGEMIAHLAFYASWPNATVAARRFLDLTEQMDAEPKAG